MIKKENEVDIYLHKKAEIINDITRSITKNLVAQGKHLLDVKERLGHGKWGPWVLEHCNFSLKHAQQVMNYYLLSLGHPELMEFKKCVIYELGSDNYPEILKEELSLYMRRKHYDLNLTNALALRKDYINGKIDLDSPSIIKYLTEVRHTSQVCRLKVEGERLDKILQREIKAIEKILTIEIAIDDDVNEQARYRKMLIKILGEASKNIANLNDTFDIVTLDIVSDKNSQDFNVIPCSLPISSRFFLDEKYFYSTNISDFESMSHSQHAYKFQQLIFNQKITWCKMNYKIKRIYNA